MRKGCLALAALVAILLAAAAGFLASGYFAALPSVQLAAQRSLTELAQQVPPDIDQAIVAPAFGPLVRALGDHPITRDAVERYDQSARIKLLAAIVGSAPFAAWSEDDSPRLLIEVGGLRRSMMLLASNFISVDLTTHGKWIAVGPFRAVAPTPFDAASSGAGHLFVLHREGNDRYPPVGRPAITTVTLGPRDLQATSGARSAEVAPTQAGSFEYSDSALFSVAFWQPHAVLKDLDRFLPVDLQKLASRGAMLTIYDVDTSGLLPRPKGFIALPDTPEAVEAAASLFNSAAFEQLGDSAVVSRNVGDVKIDRGRRLGATIEVARAHGRVYIGFDTKSLESYLTGVRKSLAAPPGGSWSVRADADRLRPVAEELAEHRGLRFIASRVARAARQMRSLLRMLPSAGAISADKSMAAGLERVHLVVSSK